MPRELLDLDIEEISAVDFPANKRTFLVIKRAGESVALPAVTDSLPTVSIKRGWLRGILDRLTKQLDEEVAEAPQTHADTFADELMERRMYQICGDLCDFNGALHDAIMGILLSTEADKRGLILQALQDFSGAVTGALADWMGGTEVEKVGRKISDDRLKRLQHLHTMLGQVILEGGGDVMTPEQKSTWPPEAVQEIETLTASLTTVTGELEKARTPQGTVVKIHIAPHEAGWGLFGDGDAPLSTHDTEQAAAVALVQHAGLTKADDRWKGVSPAIRARLEKAEEAIAKSTQIEKRDTYIRKASQWPRLLLKADDHWPLMQAVYERLEPDHVKALETVLNSANEMVKAVYTEHGTRTVPTEAEDGSALREIERKAQELLEKGTADGRGRPLTKQQAIAKVASDNPALARRYQDEMKARQPR